MIVATLLALQHSTAPNLEKVLRAEPIEAGELVLQGEQHGPVVNVETVEETMAPPGSARLNLFEQAAASGNECRRRRWTANFQDSPEDESTDKILSNVYSTTEIAFTDRQKCPSGKYVHLNPGISPEQGFSVLVSLNKIRSESRMFQFDCSDSTTSDLCSGAETIQHELARLDPWAISQKDGEFEIWLGTPGQIVTTVRFDPSHSTYVSVDRRIPAPF